MNLLFRDVGYILPEANGYYVCQSRLSVWDCGTSKIRILLIFLWKSEVMDIKIDKRQNDLPGWENIYDFGFRIEHKDFVRGNIDMPPSLWPEYEEFAKERAVMIIDAGSI